jgi:branched-chain amino acid transport system permease protein
VLPELVTAIWGAELIPLTRPAAFDGAWVLGDAVIEKFRVLCAAAGLLVFGAMMLILHGTRIGLLVRAGVANGEMVQALGYRVRTLFVGVSVAGAALAGMGGVLWGCTVRS